MVIKSPFTDYYDWVANRYGGGDPRVVYARTRLKPAPKAGDLEPDVLLVPAHRAPPHPRHVRESHVWNQPVTKTWALLVIAGKLYLLSRPITDLSVSISSYHLEPLVDPEEEKNRWRHWRTRDVELGVEYPWLIALCREVGHPVFVVTDVSYIPRSNKAQVSVAGECPILGKLGIASLISPEQMYQDLSYFVGNLMHKSPDVEPPVELSNKQKIIKAGFDLVKSFRHRK